MAAPYAAHFDTIRTAGSSRAETVDRLDRLATLLDTAFVIPGTRIRFGLDGIIGLVPWVGDLASAALSSYIIWEARRLGLPRWKIGRMILNTGLDAAIGAVPLLGDAVDVLFKANRRNIKILRDHLAEEARAGVVEGEYRVLREGR